MSELVSGGSKAMFIRRQTTQMLTQHQLTSDMLLVLPLRFFHFGKYHLGSKGQALGWLAALLIVGSSAPRCAAEAAKRTLAPRRSLRGSSQPAMNELVSG